MDYIKAIAKLFNLQNSSLYLQLDKNDFLKGLIVAVLSLPISTIYTLVENWVTTDQWGALDWKVLVKGMGIALFSYLSKNLLTPSQTTLVSKDQASK
jgi:hypothetical protein